MIVVNIFLKIIIAQQITDDNEVRFSDFQKSSARYMTDEKGNILMYVNVWGEVQTPGHHLVYEGIDLGTLLSIVGGTKAGANLKKVRIFPFIQNKFIEILTPSQKYHWGCKSSHK